LRRDAPGQGASRFFFLRSAERQNGETDFRYAHSGKIVCAFRPENVYYNLKKVLWFLKGKAPFSGFSVSLSLCSGYSHIFQLSHEVLIFRAVEVLGYALMIFRLWQNMYSASALASSEWSIAIALLHSL
jgi:hypothetical protein